MLTRESAAIEQPKANRSWIWVLGVVALALVGHGVTQQAESVSNFAFSIGYWLVPIALGSALFCAIFKGSREYRYRVFVILYGSALVGAWFGAAIQKEEATKAIGGLRESFTSFADQVNSDQNASAKPIEIRPVTATASGDMGVMEVVTKQLLNDAATIRNDYLKALDEAGWGLIMDVDRLKKDRTAEGSRTIIATATKVVQEYRAKSVALFETLPERARNAPFKSETSRRQFLAGAEKGMLQGRMNNMKNWDFEEAIMREYAGVIEVLARVKGGIQLDAKNNVLFESDADVAEYNQRMATIGQLGEQQSAHLKSIQKAALKDFDQAMPK
jgi:hypothetical protein